MISKLGCRVCVKRMRGVFYSDLEVRSSVKTTSLWGLYSDALQISAGVASNEIMGPLVFYITHQPVFYRIVLRKRVSRLASVQFPSMELNDT